MKLESIWNVLFNLVCVLGCAFQVENISLSYFSFESVTKIRYYAPETVIYPELHYCFRYLQDALDWNAIETKYGYRPHATEEEKRKWVDMITIKDIFEFTPQFEIIKCIIRDKSGFNGIISKKNNCTFFTITKYVQQQYVCYRIKPKQMKPVKFSNVHSSLYFERMLYEIHFNGILSRAMKSRTAISEILFPHIARIYAPSFFKNNYENIGILISCQAFENKFLSYPYDRQPCTDYVSYSKYCECVDKCISSQTIKHFNRKSFHEFHTIPEDIKMISDSMITNETIQMFLTVLFEKCTISCPIKPCAYSYCITNGHSKSTKIVNESTDTSFIRIESPPRPNISIEYIPSLPLLDFFIFIFTSLGIWFGFVIININPIILIRLSREYIHRRNNRRRTRKDFVINRMKMKSDHYMKYASIDK